MSDLVAKPRSVVWFWGTGGAGARMAFRVAVELAAKHGTTNVMLAVHAENPYIARAQGLGFHVVTISGVQGHNGGIRLVSRIWSRFRILQQQIKEFQGEFVVIPMNFALAWPVASWLKKSGLPFVYVVHDAEPHPGDYSPKLQKITQRLLVRAATKIVALSDFVGSELKNFIPSSSHDKISVIPLASHVARASGQKSFARDGVMKFLFMGRLLKYKGISMLSEVCQNLQHRQDWSLTIAGNGREADTVRRLFSAFPNVDLSRVKWLLEGEVDYLLRTNDILLCPYMEASQSGVLAEAIAFGMPSLVTPVGALSEQVSHGAAGWIAKDCSAAAYTQAITAILDKPEEFSQISAAALALTSSSPGKTQWADLIENIARQK